MQDYPGATWDQIEFIRERKRWKKNHNNRIENKVRSQLARNNQNKPGILGEKFVFMT